MDQIEKNSYRSEYEDIGSLELSDIIDIEVLRSIMEDFYSLTGMLGAILDISGNIVVAVGWQDICKKFHRCHSDTQKNCIESDTILTRDVAQGNFKAYHCKNGLREMVTPLIVEDKHIGNIFIGQFFYEDEVPDVELFREQARKYGFDEKEYLAALDRVPHFSRKTVDTCMQFYLKLSMMTTKLSFSLIQQSRIIRECKKAENQLKEEKEFTDIALDSQTDTFFVYETVTGKAVRWNESFRNISGYSNEEISLQKAPDSYYSMKDLKKAKDFIETVVNDGKGRIELSLICKEGHSVLMEYDVTLIPEQYDKPQLLISIGRDITQRKKEESKLKESEKKYHSLFEHMVNGFALHEIVLDKEGRPINYKFIDVNPSFEKLIGLKKENVIGENVTEVLPGTETDPADWIGKFGTVALTGKNISFENYAKKLERWYKVVAYSPKKYFFATVIEDITELKKTEELLIQTQKMEAVGELAGGIAHDFNNIMQGIYGNISLARTKFPKDHPGFKYLEDAELSMDRATLLTSQLLTFAKGGNPLKEDVDLSSLVEQITRFDLAGSNVKLNFEQMKDLWTANVDKGQIQQVFSNLIINTRQAMPDGGKLYISLKNADISGNALPGLNNGKYIKSTVRDGGLGIDKKHIDKIFDPFFTTKKTGKGLGLASVYSIIKKHNGYIKVDSELGKGTTFTIYLPASKSQQIQKKIQSRGMDSSTIPQVARILVLDDEEMICKFLKETLEANGLKVSIALDGEKVIEMYKQSLDKKEPFDAVILDLTIPGGIGGREAIKDILKIDPKAKCIVSSGYANDPVIANYNDYGFKSAIIKPYTPKPLLEVLTQVLKE